MANYVIAARSSSILDQLSQWARGIYLSWWSPGLSHGVGLEKLLRNHLSKPSISKQYSHDLRILEYLHSVKSKPRIN